MRGGKARQMFIYLLSQTKVDGYDTYDSCVVVAVSAERARQLHPGGNKRWSESGKDWRLNDEFGSSYDDWCSPQDVVASRIGVARSGAKEGVVCASFNAG